MTHAIEPQGVASIDEQVTEVKEQQCDDIKTKWRRAIDLRLFLYECKSPRTGRKLVCMTRAAFISRIKNHLQTQMKPLSDYNLVVASNDEPLAEQNAKVEDLLIAITIEVSITLIHLICMNAARTTAN